MAWSWRPLSAAILLVASLTGCVTRPEQIPAGTPRAEVVQALGNPTARYKLANPTASLPIACLPGGAVPASSAQTASQGERLQYSMQPSGQSVYNVDLDGQGRLVRAEEAMNEALFGQRILPDRWTREDVLCEYGKPARVQRVHSFKGDIWVWRFTEGPTWRLLFIDIDPQGVVRGYSTGDEPLPDDRAP
ncbi:hypothetical protein [Ottowia thiooxydans]|uniref:Lipoprotein transmembrane n=1 Tax=Ottowia thiooxydans TaxID=219182 RepID=A0ABV2Q7Q4_9BURK